MFLQRDIRNGAMLRIYNVSILSTITLKILILTEIVKVAHVVDRVQEFYAIPESLLEGTMVCVRKLIDVNDLFQCEYDKNLYNKWMGFYSP